MKHRASASRLKAKMGQYMRAVREGDEIVVTDRDQPVARLVPYREPPSREADEVPIVRPRNPAAPPFAKVTVKPISYRGPSTSSLLEADRRRR